MDWASLIRLIRSQTTYPRLSPDPSLEVPVTHLTVLITHWHLQVAGYNQTEWTRERFGIRIKLNSLTVMIPVHGSKLNNN